jgi:cytochrome c oxidase subunit 4
MAHAPANPAPKQFDELDPHGAAGHGQHASHVIVGPFTLRTVLALLLFFTVLTVGQAQLEVYLSHALDIEFPRWVNIVFCMGIAVIKALLVMGYFMQLKYDNPINSVVMAFTFLGLGLFLGFTALDLGGRGSVYEWKVNYQVPGGTNTTVDKAKKAFADGKSNQEVERIRAIIKHEHHEDHVVTSSPQRSRGKTGLSGALDASAPDAHEGHGAHDTHDAKSAPAAPAAH